ncbi:MAG: glycosyltransferase family 39 protein [Burkholderiales bacterium]|nr:glycosyltransferase family 39 protein [Burkholderiales bacterium]
MQGGTSKRAGLLLVAGAFVVYTLWLAWVGWLDSDDHRHVDGALGWSREFPYLPQHHGEFRHLITLPMALAFRLFGVSEATLIAPQLLYYVATLALTWFWVGRYFGQRVSLAVLLILASLPVFAIQATVVFSDITELFFVAVSFWLFLAARERADNTALLVVSGVAAGCAWLTRETTIALLLTYAILFLAGWGIPRGRYFLMAGGFLAVVLAEALLMYAMTGNPLYRYMEILSARETFSYRGQHQGELFDGIGNVHVARWIDPLLALYVNHEFGVLFLVVLPALVWLWRRPQLPAPAASIARVLSVLGAVWFIAAAVMLANMHPRYFTVTAYAAAIVCALWIVHGLWPRHWKAAALVGGGVIAAGLMAIYVDNRNPLAGERALKELLQTHPGIVHTDPQTARRAKFLLELDGLDKRVSTDPPPAGSIYYYNPNRERDLRSQGFDPSAYQPRANWAVLWQKQDPERILGVMLKAAGLKDKLHPSLWRRLSEPNRPVAAYRVEG